MFSINVFRSFCGRCLEYRKAGVWPTDSRDGCGQGEPAAWNRDGQWERRCWEKPILLILSNYFNYLLVLEYLDEKAPSSAQKNIVMKTQ